MDRFIRTELNLNKNLSLIDVVANCIRLLSWLLDNLETMRAQSTSLKLNYTDVECMFKSTLYLFECYDRFGDALVEAIQLERIDSPHTFLQFLDNCTTQQQREQIVQELSQLILSTSDGHEYAAILWQIHKSYSDLQPAWEIIKSLNWSVTNKQGDDPQADDAVTALTELNVHATQMRFLVRKLFRLSNVEQIEKALHRALGLIDFEIWLHLFREPKNSIIFSRCYILRQMICDMLNEGTAPACADFVHNIYQHIATDAIMGVHHFWQCLAHVRFAGSLIAYISNYWSTNIQYVDLDDVKYLANSAPPTLALEVVLYLTHLMLAPKSLCRIQFHTKLRSLKLENNLKALLNKVAYVYS